MRVIDLKDLKILADQVRTKVWDKALAFKREPKLYLHWSAGRYQQTFADYHINITGSGQIYLTTDDLSATLSHTWRRNSGSIGITLCCAYGATTNNLGYNPPTKVQIEVMAKVVQVLADSLWLTIDKVHVLTHGEAADNEDGIWAHPQYGPKTTYERWDLEFLGTDESPSFNPNSIGHRGGDIIRGKANWYRNMKGRR